MPINPAYKQARLIAAQWCRDNDKHEEAARIENQLANLEDEILWADEALEREAAEAIERLREASSLAEVAASLIALDEAASAHAAEVGKAVPEADDIPGNEPKGPAR